MMSSMSRARHFLILIASVIPAMAHPPQFHAMDGIGATQVGFLHSISGLDHLLVMVAVGLWAVQIGGRALWALPCSFVGSMMLGGVVGLCGTHLPLLSMASWPRSSCSASPFAWHGSHPSLLQSSASELPASFMDMPTDPRCLREQPLYCF